MTVSTALHIGTVVPSLRRHYSIEVISLKYEDISIILLEEFPAFSIEKSDIDLPYIVAGCFTKYLLEAYQSKEQEIYIKGLEFIERLHLDDNVMVNELATIGYLESIQNTWPQDLIDINIPFRDLGEQSQLWWAKLNAFWDGDMKALSQPKP